MESSDLLIRLQQPEAYPQPTSCVELRQTHISVIFLTDNFAYKIKKPVNLGFLDFTSLKKRHHYCNEEVRLNSRFAPGVYLGVVPVVMTEKGPRFEVDGTVIEWAVKMKRLPDEATLLSRMELGQLTSDTFSRLGNHLATLHLEAGSPKEYSRFGSFETVAQHVRDNIAYSRRHVGTTVTTTLLDKLEAAAEAALSRLTPLIAKRANSGMTRDTHGDLHLDHVYYFPRRAPPQDLLILDCVEFSDYYRISDVVSDMAFLAMDLIFHGRRDWMETFTDSYFAATKDEEGRGLLDFYISYRAAVRAKVEGIKAVDEQVEDSKRVEAANWASAHWLLALSSLLPPLKRPFLALTCGLPGTGKSQLASDLEAKLGVTRISSDLVRKELAGIKPDQSARAPFGEGIYTPANTAKTYAECSRRAKMQLLDGNPVVVDAAFGVEALRRDFIEMARSLCVVVLIFHRTAPVEVVRKRLAGRSIADPVGLSDADWEIFQQAATRWERFGEEAGALAVEIPHMTDAEAPYLIALEKIKTASP